MTQARATPIGRTWTKVLICVGFAGTLSADGVTGAALPGWPRWQVACLLSRMTNVGYLNQRSDEVGPIEPLAWGLSSVGSRVLADLARPRRRAYKTTYGHRKRAKARRAALAADRLCINGRSHGPATHGPRCEGCAATHRRSA